MLFNDTYRENIKYNLDVSDEEMIEAAKKAYAYDFIMNAAVEDEPLKEEPKKKKNKKGEV